MPYLNYIHMYCGSHKRISTWITFHNDVKRDEIVCMLDKELSTSFMDLQVHLLIHLVDDVELVGVFSCHWMLFLESYMKK